MIYSNNKWSFTIKYSISDTDLEENKDYTVSILYKESPNLAECKKENYSILKWILEQNGQTKLDLIRLNKDADDADIKWTNLIKDYDIPIQCSLRYVNAFNLTLNKNNSYTFVVEIEKNSLPENSFVKMDIYYKENLNATYCHSNSLLMWQFFYQINKKINNNNWTAKILVTKNIGTIEWSNLNIYSNIYIPVIVTLSGYENRDSIYR